MEFCGPMAALSSLSLSEDLGLAIGTAVVPAMISHVGVAVILRTVTDAMDARMDVIVRSHVLDRVTVTMIAAYQPAVTVRITTRTAIVAPVVSRMIRLWLHEKPLCAMTPKPEPVWMNYFRQQGVLSPSINAMQPANPTQSHITVITTTNTMGQVFQAMYASVTASTLEKIEARVADLARPDGIQALRDRQRTGLKRSS